MLYLPATLTAKQVPEAARLVPVKEGRETLGTIIIISVDGPNFSTDEPAHVKAAHDIEVRLVDQDLLPTYLQIQEQSASDHPPAKDR